MMAVLLHGLGGSSFDWRPAAAASAVSCLPLDLPFHGGRPLDRPVTFTSLVDDVLARIDRAPDEELLLGGISIGSAVAIDCAARLGRRVAGLLLVAPVWHHEDRSTSRTASVAKLGRLILRRGLTLAGDVACAVPPVAGWSEDDRRAFAAHFGTFDAHAVGTAMVALSQERPAVDLAGAAAHRPATGVVAWTADTLHPVEDARLLAGRLEASFLRTMPRPTDRRAEARVLATAIEDVAALVPETRR